MDQTKRLLVRLGKLDKTDVSPDIIFSSTNLSRFYFPGRGIIPSFVMHVIACTALFLPTLLRTFILPLPPPDQVVFIDLHDPRTVMYLPPLQGNAPQPAAGKKTDLADGKTAPKARKEGLTYPGLQPILSDPPKPTNSIQTILQPLETPKTLVPPLPVPNIVQTEEIPMVVQSPRLPELELAGRERLQVNGIAGPAAEIPDPLFTPSEDYPAFKIPDLLAAPGTESEMALPEQEIAPRERMRTPLQNPAATDLDDGAIAAPTGIPKPDIPELLRMGAGPEPEMALLEQEIAPRERMRTPVRNPAATDLDDAAIAAPTGIPKPNITELLRMAAGPEPEMALPETQKAPVERIRTSGKQVPSNSSGPRTTAPSGSFPKMEIPDLMRASGPDNAMALPESKREPRKAIRTSGPKLQSGIPEAGYAPPPATPPGKKMPEMVKVSPPTQGTSAGSGGNPDQLSSKPVTAGSASGADEAMRETASPAGEEERILILTPMPALPAFRIEIPEGEAQGGFAISPDPNLETPSVEPGAQSEKAQEQKEFEILTLETAEEAGALPSGPGTTENAAGTDDSDGDVQAPFITVPTGTGEDAFDGITIIGGSEQPQDGMNDALSTPSEDENSGFEIFGGTWEPGNAQSLPPVRHPPKPLQNDYWLSIISNNDSGGVLPSTNFFKNTRYTVYLDMRESIDEEEQQWILEFGLLDDLEINPVLSLDFESYTEGLVLPFPSRKKRPSFPEALVRKYWGSMILVSGIVNTKGKMEQLSIMDSPNPQLDVGLLDTLATWAFRPARLNGQPVAVKIMIGIPF